MKILHIARWCSARVYKQVIAQQCAGWDVTLMAGQTPHVDLHSMVDKQIGWCSPDALLSVVNSFDVVVFHTTLSTHDDVIPLAHFLSKTINAHTRFIWDCHDFKAYEDDSTALEASAFHAITTPSQGMAKHFENATCIYSKVPESLWPEHSVQFVDAVVFEGTMGNGEAWADYSALESRLGRPVFFYPSGGSVAGHEHCRLMQRLPYRALLSALTGYTAGYAGASREDVTIHDCVTNKFWEYIAAGLHVITYNSDEMTELNNAGWSKLNATMESELSKMEEAYNGYI